MLSECFNSLKCNFRLKLNKFFLLHKLLLKKVLTNQITVLQISKTVAKSGTQINRLLLSAKGSKDLNYGIGRQFTGIKSFGIKVGLERIKFRDQTRDLGSF